MIEGDWGTLVDLGGDGVKCVSSPRRCTLCGVAVASAPRLRFDRLRPAAAVRVHGMLESTQLPQGSSRSHLTWSLGQNTSQYGRIVSPTFLSLQVSHFLWLERTQEFE